MTISYLITNIHLSSSSFDGWKPNSSVLIRGGLIDKINPESTDLDPDVIRIEGNEQYLLPGLIEMHGHFYGRANVEMRSQHKGYCPLYLAGGITTVRTPGEFEPEVTFAWKQSIERGQTVGPRIMTGGWYFDQAPSIIRWFKPSESIEAIRDCFEDRDKISDFFKVYSSMPTDWIGEVCRLGHAKGKKVYGHLGLSTTIGAIEAGLDGVEHGFFTIQEFHSKASPSVDSEGLESLDMNSSIVRQVENVIVQHRTAVTPTMITFMLNGSAYTDWLDRIDAWKYLAPEAVTKQLEIRKAWDEDQKSIDQQERLMDKQRKFVGDLYRQGARIFCGTDPSYPMILPGKAIVYEAANLVDCGIPNSVVLRALTQEAADELLIGEVTGSISEGKQADLVLLEQDPLSDINNLETVRLVWKSGRMHDPEDLRRSAIGQIA